MVPGQSKEALYKRGHARALDFCLKNKIKMPEMRPTGRDVWRFDGTCAYYRPTYIAICVEKCAAPGFGGRLWSWPGYVVDRTPFGVIQHELGHHVDIVMSGETKGYMGSYSARMREWAKEDPITTYCPNYGEWFAEIFRLFVTNADLLRLLRPESYALLRERFTPVSHKDWRTELQTAPQRYFDAAQRKIDRYYEA